MRIINPDLIPLVNAIDFVAIEDESISLAAEKQEKGSRSPGSAKATQLHVVIIIENMTVPADRRVWQQASALRDDGWKVTIISPKIGSFRKAHEVIDGIEIYRHPLIIEARHISAYALEYAGALICEIDRLLKIGIGRIDVVQICNPPDFLFLPALIAKRFGNAKIVFDHHDLTPELLVQKTGSENGWLLKIARWAERMTFSAADFVISTNSVFRTHAIEYGGKHESDVDVVYSTPDLENLKPGSHNSHLKNGSEILLLWVGVIGSQDGVGLLLETIAALRNLPGGDKFHLLIAGDGPERKCLETQSKFLGLEKLVTFAGFLDGDELANAFATADIGVGADPKNRFNDRLAMNKTLEYMAYALPIAMFDLNESRKIAEDCAFYASNNDPKALAACISNLIEAPTLRHTMGNKGKKRLDQEYSWGSQKQRYLNVYRSVLRTV